MTDSTKKMLERSGCKTFDEGLDQLIMTFYDSVPRKFHGELGGSLVLVAIS